MDTLMKDGDVLQEIASIETRSPATTASELAGSSCATTGEPLTRAQHVLALAQTIAAASKGVRTSADHQCDRRQRTVVSLKISDLKPHPRQAEIFAGVPDEQITALATSMAESGLDHPIEVLPDLTIVGGHCRVEAARRIGWTEIDAIIRYDLAAQDELAVEQYMIRDNFLRRQLSPLQRARCALLLKEIMLRRRCDGEQLDRYARIAIRQNASTRDEIGGMLGISGREVSRLVRVLETPPEVQAAFDTGRLSLVLADKIAGLDADKQQMLAQAIANGENAAAAMQRIVVAAADKSLAVTSVYLKLLRAIKDALDKLDGHISEIEVRYNLVDEHVAALKSAVPLLRRLVHHEQATRRRRVANTKRLLGKLADLGGSDD